MNKSPLDPGQDVGGAGLQHAHRRETHEARRNRLNRLRNQLAVAAAITFVLNGEAQAQGRGGPPQEPPPTPRAAAPIDLTGYWVSVVTEDWRWRMVTPAKGDYASVPLNPEGRKVADSWDPQKESPGDACRAYGAAAIMRVPGRVHITWEGDRTLKLETDAGQQTRSFEFDGSASPLGERQWQGHSVAEWQQQFQTRGLGFGGRPSAGGSLKVVTTHLRPGYLRKNGVPYSENAIVTEYFSRHSEPNGDEWFTVTVIVEDPKFLTMPFITSSSFKREPNQAKWDPTMCEGGTATR